MDECLIFNSEQSSHKDVKIFTDMSSACVHNFNGLKYICTTFSTATSSATIEKIILK